MSDFTYGMKPGLSYNIAVNSSTSTAAAHPISVGVRLVRLVAPIAARATIGGGTPVCTVSSIFLPAQGVEYVQCSGNGTETVAGLSVSTSTSINVTEMTQ